MATWFERYAEMSRSIDSPTIVNGRYIIQQYSEAFILSDVINKLKLTKDDVLLDIGCGTGLLCMPLTQVCRQVYALDNQDAIDRLTKSYVPSNCRLYSGSWLECKEPFPDVNKIICYSVLHYLHDLDEVFAFIDKMLVLLPENGMILLGDIPNVDKKKRFTQSQSGMIFDSKFKKEQATSGNMEKQALQSLSVQPIDSTVAFDDESIVKILSRYRMKGNDVYILPQPEHLPFGMSREDILIVKKG